MTAYPSAVLIGVATLALAVVCSCQRSRSGPSGATADAVPPDAAVLDIAGDDDETSGAEDSLTVQDMLQEVVDEDVADVVGGVDTSADVELSPLCAAVKLPEPGQACNEEGAARCSNAGAEERDWSIAMGIGCFRPNTLRCTMTADGLVWKLESCESITGLKAGVPIAGVCASYVSCVVRSDTDHGCQPTSISDYPTLKKQPAAAQTSTLSDGHFVGGQWCSSAAKNPQRRPGAPAWCKTNVVVQCMPIEKSPFKDQVLAAAGDCAKYLLKGEWTFPIELCQVDTISCKPKEQKCVLNWYRRTHLGAECKEYYHLGCMVPGSYTEAFYDSTTDKIRCTKDCFEAGAPGYAPGE